MQIAVKFLLLTYAVELSAVQEFLDSSSGRSAININQTIEDNNTLRQNPSAKFLSSLLRQIKTCAETYPETYNKTLDDLMDKIKHRNISVSHANVTKLLIDWFKDKVDVNVYRDIIVLRPKNTFLRCRVSTSGEMIQMEVHSKNFVFLGKRRVRDTLLESNLIETNTKVPEKSHIYLGLSLYPLLTEETRIIDKYHTLPPPVYTARYAQGGVKKNPPLKGPPGIRLVQKEQPKLFTESYKPESENK